MAGLADELSPILVLEPSLAGAVRVEQLSVLRVCVTGQAGGAVLAGLARGQAGAALCKQRLLK